MKKKAMALAALVVLLGVLGIVYAFFAKNTGSEDSEEKKDNDYSYVINMGEDAVLSEVTAHRNEIPDDIGVYENYDLGDSTMRVYLDGDNYFIEGYEDMPLSGRIGDYINGFYTLASSMELKEHDDLSVYGLTEPKAAFDITYKDGTKLELSVGNLTADGLGYYVNTSLSESVYVVTLSFIETYFYGLNELIDKSLPEINQDEITFISLNDTKGDKDLIITYDNTEDAAAEGNELTPLVMRQPKNGLAVYPYNLQTTLFSGMGQLKLVDVVKTRPDDLGMYGLDEPLYKLTVMDSENTVALDIGMEADDTYTFCKLPDSDIVYTVFTKGVEPFIDYNIYEFVERFVNLKYRRNIEEITIDAKDGRDYTLEFGEDELGQEGVDNRVAILNGNEYDRAGISDFYQLLIGIAFERIDEGAALPEGEPELVITYNMLDGSKSVDAYYGFDSNYYIVEKDGENTGFIVSRTYMSRMLSKAAELAA